MGSSKMYDEQTTVNMSLQIPSSVMDDLQRIATARELDIHDMIISYIHHGVLEDLPMAKRVNFFSQTKETLRRHKVEPESVDECVEKFTY